MRLSSATRVCLLVALAIGGGATIGWLIHRGLQSIPEVRRKPVAQLIRDLRRRDSVLDSVWQSVWPVLPDTVTRNFPGLAPRYAASIRQAAAAALQGCGPEAQKAVPALITVLTDTAPEVRLSAIQALRELGPLAEPAAPALIELFKDWRSAPAPGSLVSARGEAALALGTIAPTDSRVFALLRDIVLSTNSTAGSIDAEVRRQAVLGLERMAAKTNAALTVLVAALQESGFEFNPAFLNPLEPPKRAGPQTERINLSTHIIAALGRIGSPTALVLATLQRALQSHTDDIRLGAVQALGNLGPGAAPAMPELLKLLDETRAVPPPVEAPPEPERRWALVPAAGQMNLVPPGLVSFVQPLLAGRTTNQAANLPSPPFPGMGIPTVTRFGILDRMPQAVPLHSAVLHTLGQIGPAASNALPTLIAESKDTNHPGRFEAALARWQIDGQTDDAKAVFRPGLQHTNRLVRQKAVAFLSRLGIPALPELIDALTNDNARVRIDAIDALATCGPAATAAAPRLEETLSDGKYIVRRQAAAALQKIRGQSQPRPSMDSSTQSAKGAP